MQRLLLIAMSIVVLAAPSAARAGHCPPDARKASLALWPGGSIPTGKTVSGTHPCGRKLNCIGGTPGNFSSRQCHWE
jgi:hypothetical protein